MDRFLRLWAPAAALGLIVGCAGEEGANVTTPPAPTTTPVPAPDATPAPPPVNEAPKTDQAPELTPAETHKAEAAEHPEGTEAKPAGETKVEEAKPAEEPKADESKADKPLTPPQAEEPKAEEPKAEAAAPSLEGPGTASEAALSDEEIAEIKKLPVEDHALALAQAVCPVSGENLGSMDVPIKTSIEGRDFFICCNGCMKKVKNDPKSVLAKLDAK